MEEDELDELENDTRSVQSSSRLTARQAAIASGFDTEHVQLSKEQILFLEFSMAF